MPIISAGDLDDLRTKNQKTQIYMSVLRPITLWSAVIDSSPTIDKGETLIPFDGGSGLSFAAIEALQELWVGVGIGTDTIGRLRIKSINSSDGGVTGTVVVARNTLDLLDNANLTFKHTYPLKPKYPLISGPPSSAVFLKDGDIPYSDQNDDTLPVVIAGENRAGFIDDTLGYFEITSQLPDSYVTKSGATITSYSASAYPTTGVTISINAGSGVGFIRFATAGIYWVKWTVTDSNGKTQSSYRWYYAHNTGVNDTHYPETYFDINQISGDWQRGGWETGITVNDNATLADIPDKTGVILWQVASYNGVVKNITFLPDNSNTIVSGNVRKEKLERDIGNDSEDVDFQIVTLDALLRNHYMFSVSLAARETPTEWYEYNANLTIPQALHHFWRWHSTLFEIADVFLGDNTLGRAYAELEDGTLYSMADDLARNKGIRAHVVCDKGNRVHLCPDIQLLTDGERAVLPVVQSITSEDISGDMTLIREPYNRTAFVKTSGFSFDKTFSSTGCPDPPCPNVAPLCASAPGDMPDDEGANIVDFDRQVFEDQSHCDALAGRFFAQVNNRYPELRINFPGNYLGVLDVMLPEFWQIDLDATDFIREILWVNKNLICRSITIQVDVEHGAITCNGAFEPEQDAGAGVAGYCLYEVPDIPGDPGDIDIPPQPGTGFGTVYVRTRDHLGRTRDLSVLNPSWVSIATPPGTDEFYDFILDPWDPIHNGLLMGTDGVYISYDLDQVAPSFTQIISQAEMETLAGVTDFRRNYSIKGSITHQGFFAFGAAQRLSSQRANTWIFVTPDYGANWSAHLVHNGASADGTQYEGTLEISPHPSGSGQPIIYVGTCRWQTVFGDQRRVYRSTDGGTTWTLQVLNLPTDTDAGGSIKDMHVPYNDNDNSDIVLICCTEFAGSNGLARSEDGGVTWNVVGAGYGLSGAFKRTPFQTFTEDRTQLYAPANDEFYLSVDDGATFNLQSTLPSAITAAGGFPYNNQQFYLVSSGQILVSIDSGVTWIDKTGDWAFGFLLPLGDTGGGIGLTVVPCWLE